MEKIVFRKAIRKDIEPITSIYEEVHEEIENGKIWIGWIKGVYPTRDTVVAAIERDDLFVMEEEEKIVGVGIINQQQMDVYKETHWRYHAPDNEVMVLHTLAISPKIARKGYGSRFVELYESYAKEQGCEILRMDTNERNTNARALYKKLGYDEVEMIPCTFNGIEGFHLVMLEKYIGEKNI